MTGHRLVVQLDGGTGDLFKYMGENFPASIYSTGFENVDGWPLANPTTQVTTDSIDGWDITRWGGTLETINWRIHSGAQALRLNMGTAAGSMISRTFVEAGDRKTRLDFWATVVDKGPFQIRILNAAGADIVSVQLLGGRIYHGNLLNLQQSGDTYTAGNFVHIILDLNTLTGKYDLFTYGNSPRIWKGSNVVSAGAAGKLTITGNWSSDGTGYGVVDDVRLGPVVPLMPTPAQCGDVGTVYMESDLNSDCRVDINDFAILANQWLLSSSN